MQQKITFVKGIMCEEKILLYKISSGHSYYDKISVFHTKLSALTRDYLFGKMFLLKDLS